MGWFSKDTGEAVKSAGEGVKTAADGVTGIIGGIRNLVTGDLPPATVEALKTLEVQAQEIDVKLAEISQNIQKGQQEIEKAAIDKGGFNSFFLAGWRPTLGWICAASIFFYYVPPIILQTVFWVKQTISTGMLTAWPNSFDIAEIIGLVASLLGLSFLRTNEKKTNTQDNH